MPFLDSSAVRLAAGDLEAVFLPRYGMLGASMRRRGVELLGRVENLEAAAESGSTAGIPLLHPWANRLDAFHYRAAGRFVRLDLSSPLLHFDARGLPIHGVPWSKLTWQVMESGVSSVDARLDWSAAEFLAIFPFPHSLALRATLGPDALTLELTLTAGPEGPVPVAFGFHPYFAIPGPGRRDWVLELPAMRRFRLDPSGLPTGDDDAFGPISRPLADHNWDDGFALEGETATLGISAGDFAISVDLLEGFGYAQVYAPPDRPFIALEPMSAPTSALTTGRGLRTVPPGGRYRAAFRIRVEAA